ncbi:MAG TPA: hypothetical protein VFB38_06330 [Chthonomonadaceae bacterium]|nr:hypothetical protein [Chthonomonadaceae bacterium]
MTTRDAITIKVWTRMALALLGLLALLPARPIRADAFSYSGQRRQVKACILYSNTDTDNDNDYDLDNFAPYVFYVLDNRNDLKPAGWEFVNPLAPGTITPDMVVRMQKRANGNDPTINAGLFKVNAPLTKNMAAYWEVNLDTVAAKDLRQFDIILMPIRSNELVRLTPERAAKLRQAVDGGATLWLEDEGGNGSYPTSNFLVNVQFTDQRGGNTLLTLASAHHPLVNFPYPISAIEVQRLGANGPGYYHTDAININQLPNPLIVVPVVFSGNFPYVSAGDFGAGHLVISSAGVATAISSYAGGVTLARYGGNTGAVSGDNFLAARPVDLKFAYNLIAWTSSVPTSNANVRRTTSTDENIGSQLGRKFSAVPIIPSNPGSGAVLHKGVVFSVDGNNILHAYDANPAADQDGDQNPDDGLPDFSRGASYDEIWNLDLKGVGGVGAGTRISTPTIVSFFDTNLGAPRDLVTVTTSNGVTMAFEAFPRDNNGRLLPTSALVWQARVESDGDLTATNAPSPLLMPSPALSEGVLFTVVKDSTGSPNSPWRVAALNPTTGRSIFDNSSFNGATNNTVAPSVPQSGQNVAGMQSVVGPLTVGYVRDASTGAIDKVVYVTCAPGTGGAQQAYVNAIWFSTRNEPLESVEGSNQRFRAHGNRGLIPWYIPQQNNGNVDLEPVLHIITKDDSGNITNIQQLRYQDNGFTVEYTSTTGPGQINGGLIVNLNQQLQDPQHQTVVADYTVDWPGAPVGTNNTTPTTQDLGQFSVQRGRFTVFDVNPNAPAAMISGAPALTRDDLLIFGTKNQLDSTGNGLPDRLYGFREQFTLGTTNNPNEPNQLGSEVAWMWSPPDSSGFAFGATTLPPRLVNTDTLGNAPNVVLGPITGVIGKPGFQIKGSPAVANGVAYVVATSYIQTTPIQTTPVTVIAALRANPSTTFSSGLQNIPPGQSVTLKQIDMSSSTAISPRYITLLENVNFTVDRQSGMITIHNFRQMPSGDSFNMALPIYVVVGGEAAGEQVPDTPVTNQATGFGPLDNLLWYMVIPPNIPNQDLLLQAISPASGPSIIGNSLYFGTVDGRVVSVDIPNETGGRQATLYPNNDPSQPIRVHAQVAMLQVTGNIGAPLSQPIIHPPVGTANLVAVGTPAGLSGLDNRLTVIADSTRLLEIDYGGNAVWDLSATRSYGVAGGQLPIYEGGNAPVNSGLDTGQITTQKVPLTRPNVAYRTTLNDFLIADTGNNRVVQVDKGGNVTLEIHSLRDDMHFLRAGDPVTLNHPTDVSTYVQSSNATNAPISIANRDTGVTYNYTGPYYALHYVIADSGNYRALEVASVYGPDGRPIVMTGTDGTQVEMQNQVIFVTRSLAEQNARFRYRTIQQFFDPTSNQTFLISAVDNVSLSGIGVPAQVGVEGNNVEGPGGSLVVIDRFGPTDGNVSTVINSLAWLDNGKNIIHRQRINNPTWFKEFEVIDPDIDPNVPKPHYLLADNNGVYELRPNVAANGETVAEVIWNLSSTDYLCLTGRPLRAASLQRLPQSDYHAGTNKFYPHYLITNRYTGQDSISAMFLNQPGIPSGEIHGEVVEVRGIDYYANNRSYQNPGLRLYAPNGNDWIVHNAGSSIVWIAPNEVIPPVPGPIRRSIGSTANATSTYLFEQPTFSERPF